jgi:hypothetical protein
VDQHQVVESKVGEGVFSRRVGVGTYVNVPGRRIRSGTISPRIAETMTVVIRIGEEERLPSGRGRDRSTRRRHC